MSKISYYEFVGLSSHREVMVGIKDQLVWLVRNWLLE